MLPALAPLGDPACDRGFVTLNAKCGRANVEIPACPFDRVLAAMRGAAGTGHPERLDARHAVRGHGLTEARRDLWSRSAPEDLSAQAACFEDGIDAAGRSGQPVFLEAMDRPVPRFAESGVRAQNGPIERKIDGWAQCAPLDLAPGVAPSEAPVL